MWITTENGVARRDPDGSWRRFFSEFGGLPFSPADIAVTSDGVLYVAGLNGGLSRLENGRWSETRSEQPLHCVQINDLLGDKEGNLWIAAREGLFCQTPSGSWMRFSPASDKVSPEDFLVCLALDHHGDILCGTRKAGVLVLRPASREWQALPKGDNGVPDGYVSALSSLESGVLLVGTYGYGIRTVSSPAWKSPVEAKPMPILPVTSRPTGNEVTYLGDDRDTQGDWIGRYGTAAWRLAAMGRPYDFSGGPCMQKFSCVPRMGTKHRDGDSLRHWIHWMSTKDQRALQCPVESCRRQASWDDAGELYPPTYGGPGLLLDLEVPPGEWQTSFYFVNIDAMQCPSYWKTSDGFFLPNRFRDYQVRVFSSPEGTSPTGSPLLTSCRVTDFAGGVYARFRISGGRYRIEIDRGTSHNTVLSAVFLDPAPPLLPLGQAVEKGVAVLARLRSGVPPSDTEAAQAIATLHQRGQFRMAEELVAAIDEAWLVALEEEQAPDARLALLREWKTQCDGVQQRLHVPSHQQFVVYGHDPDVVTTLLLVPYLDCLNKTQEGQQSILEFCDQALADERTCNAVRASFLFLGKDSVSEIKAKMSSPMSANRHITERWLTHSVPAMDLTDSLDHSLAIVRMCGEAMTTRCFADVMNRNQKKPPR